MNNGTIFKINRILSFPIVLLLLFVVGRCSETGSVPSVYFCPEDHCSDHLSEQMAKAKKTVLIAVYTFSNANKTISEAVSDAAQKQGASVYVIMEKDQSANKDTASYLKARGVHVAWDTNPYLMHDKFTIVDEQVVCTGSFNYTVTAENKNNENLLIIHSKELAKLYTEEFWKLWEQSKEF